MTFLPNLLYILEIDAIGVGRDNNIVVPKVVALSAKDARFILVRARSIESIPLGQPCLQLKKSSILIQAIK